MCVSALSYVVEVAGFFLDRFYWRWGRVLIFGRLTTIQSALTQLYISFKILEFMLLQNLTKSFRFVNLLRVTRSNTVQFIKFFLVKKVGGGGVLILVTLGLTGRLEIHGLFTGRAHRLSRLLPFKWIRFWHGVVAILLTDNFLLRVVALTHFALGGLHGADDRVLLVEHLGPLQKQLVSRIRRWYQYRFLRFVWLRSNQKALTQFLI